MVVIPTDSEVTIEFNDTWAETAGNVLSLLGILGLVVVGVMVVVRSRRETEPQTEVV
jgi:Trk-type K+ transport system membrane component